MDVGEVVYNRVLRRLAPKAGGADKRSLQSLAWLVSGMTLEHDVRLERIALAMSGAPTLAGRVRRLRRCLDGAVDVQGIYQRLIADDARWWHVGRVFVVLDTTSVGGRLYFVRLALCHASRALPLAWRTYEGRSATIGFGDYQPLLEAADRLLPRRLERVLVADRGFQHVRLARWALEHGWRLRLRVKGSLGITFPDGTGGRISERRRCLGAVRCIDTVSIGAQRVGPFGLMLTWPRYGKDRVLHVLSDDPPTERTLWEFERREAVEAAFRDDKSAGFQLERSRIRDPHRLEQLLGALALAQLFLKSIGTRVLLDDRRGEVDAHYDEPGASLLQLGVRQTRMDLLRGRAPRIEVALLIDSDVRGTRGEQAMLKRFHARKGLPYTERWLPPRSYEANNVLWWLPNAIMPRFPRDQPPMLG